MNGLHVLNVPGMNTAKETKSVPQVTPSKNAKIKQKILFAIRNQSVASQIMTVKVIARSIGYYRKCIYLSRYGGGACAGTKTSHE